MFAKIKRFGTWIMLLALMGYGNIMWLAPKMYDPGAAAGAIVMGMFLAFILAYLCAQSLMKKAESTGGRHPVFVPSWRQVLAAAVGVGIVMLVPGVAPWLAGPEAIIGTALVCWAIFVP